MEFLINVCVETFILKVCVERFQGVCLCGTLLKLKLQGQNEEQLPHNSISFDYKPFYFN